MSWQAVQWALDDAPMLKTPAGKPDTTARWVLVALAERAGKDDLAWPSLAALRYTTGLDMKTIARALSRLSTAGLITHVGVRGDGVVEWKLALERVRPASDRDAIDAEVQEHRERDRRRKQSARSSGILRPDVRDSASGQEALSGTQNPDSGILRPDVRDAEPARTFQGTFQEPPNARERAAGEVDAADGVLIHLPIVKASPAQNGFEEEFADWWAAYPRRVARSEALIAYVKARKGQKARGGLPRKPATAEALLEGATRYANEVRVQRRTPDKIAHGATWLNNNRWTDYEAAPEQITRRAAGPRFEGA